MHNGFIFSTETYAKAQFNLGLLPFSLGLVEALISFRFEESEKEIKHKNERRKLATQAYTVLIGTVTKVHNTRSTKCVKEMY